MSAALAAGVLAAAAAFAAVALGGGGAARPAHVEDGRAVFARMGCGGCHDLAAANATGQIGPDLDERLAGYDRASLAARIVDPYRGFPPAEFATMPEDFGERMSAAELDALVDFLLAAAPG